MKVFFRGLVLLSLLALTACSTTPKKSYSFEPPKSPQGQACVMQCQETKNVCDQFCDAEQQNCQTRAKDQAKFDYEQYVAARTREGKPADRQVTDFYLPNTCAADFTCQCEDDFRACFQMCGGKVS
ncbi:MAG: hypothetical protein JSS53_09275 [Proteobacteria bacterium]|nr:hypothetical protein [Pseudomonadota bacterium]